MVSMETGGKFILQNFGQDTKNLEQGGNNEGKTESQRDLILQKIQLREKMSKKTKYHQNVNYLQQF